MGLGYYLSEEFQWDDGKGSPYRGDVAGRNLANGTWEYKPPFSQVYFCNTRHMQLRFCHTVPFRISCWHVRLTPLFGIQDIPLEFNISLEPNHPNPMGIFASKASGEPAVCLASSAVFAAQHAVQALGFNKNAIEIDAPCTVEKLFLASAVDPTTFTLQ